MPAKKTVTEPEVKICSYCGNEILGSYEHIRTKRKSELYICIKCVANSINQK